MKIDNRTNYEKRIQDRSYLRYLIGLIVRFKNNIKYSFARSLAKRNGAQIGEGVIMSISLAKKMNSNCKIGNHVSIQTDQIDTRAPLHIGNHVVIGGGTKIITGSHNIDSLEWEYKKYGLFIEDYVWIPTNVLILPSCRNIKYGAVVGSGSVVVKNVESMSVISGNPAYEFKKRKCVHENIVVESLLGGDYYIYKKTWKERKACRKI